VFVNVSVRAIELMERGIHRRRTARHGAACCAGMWGCCARAHALGRPSCRSSAAIAPTSRVGRLASFGW